MNAVTKLVKSSRRSSHIKWSLFHHPRKTKLTEEIYLLILYHVTAVPDLVSITRCNRQLRFLAEPLIYRTLDFTHCPVRAILFSHTMLSRPDLALAVTSLCLPDFSHIRPNVHSAHHIKKQDKLRIALGKAQIAILERTLCLESLRISLVVHSSTVAGMNQSEKLISLPLLLANLPLKSLVFTGRTSDSDTLFQMILSPKSRLQLQHLEIPHRPDYFFPSKDGNRVTTASICHLQTYAGPSSLFQCIAPPGLGLREIRLNEVTQVAFDGVLTALQHSDRSLKVLKISLWHVIDGLAVIGKHFGSSLCQLYLKVSFLPDSNISLERFIEEVPNHLSHMSKLEVLDLSGSQDWPSIGSANQELNGKARCEKWRESCHTLKEVVFPSGERWQTFGNNEIWALNPDTLGEDESSTQVDDGVTQLFSDLHRKRSKVL